MNPNRKIVKEINDNKIIIPAYNKIVFNYSKSYFSKLSIAMKCVQEISDGKKSIYWTYWSLSYL